MTEAGDHGESYCGYLFKKGKIRKNWLKRWFILEGGQMKYFKKMNNYKPIGVIQVKGELCRRTNSTTTKFAHSFEIQNEKRTFYLYAESEEDLLTWKKKIIQSGGFWEVDISPGPSLPVFPTLRPSTSSSRISTIKDDGSVEEQEITEQEQLEMIKSQNERLRKELQDLKTNVQVLQTRVMSSEPPSTAPTKTQEVEVGLPGNQEHVTIVVVGASGDLARKKTFPSLFSLYSLGLLPPNFTIVGFARSELSVEQFRKQASQHFKGNEEHMQAFLSHCHYLNGQYNSSESFRELDKMIVQSFETSSFTRVHRMYYLAIPPSIFIDVATALHSAAMAKNGWTRIVVEKPFGHDLNSSRILSNSLAALFKEEQLFRIDHYLGKEMVQNLMALRFGNLIFEPLWDRKHVANVMITFKEDIGTEGRGGYFDQFGIIRDVMQNHLLQIFALVAMEEPISLSAEYIRDEKTKVLKATRPIVLEDVVIGQYTKDAAGKYPGYLDDPTVPKDSKTATFATAVLHIDNPRWEGVPFILKCGKALNERKAEIRIQFKPIMADYFPDAPRNELVIRVQPNEAVYLKMNTKEPGISSTAEKITQTSLDLTYKERFSVRLPDAYERLIYDVLRGDHNLFVRNDELDAAWTLFTPILHRIESEKVKPFPYEFGSRGPAASDELAQNYGFLRSEDFVWTDKNLN